VSSTSASPRPSPYPQPVAVQAVKVSKDYGTGEARVSALREVSVGFPAGLYSAIMGPSGSGKSTLMHCLAGLDSVTSGEVWLGGDKPGEKPVLLSALSDKKLTQVRRDRIGFIFQQFNLLPTLTAAENIRLPLDIAGRKVDREWFDRVVATLGLQDRLKHRPTEMSGGQIQRVACARAIVSRPAVIFADEPTGNLDSRASAEVLGFLRQSVRDLGQTVIMVTHDPTAASYADQVVFLSDGRIVDGMSQPTAESVLDRMKMFDAGAAGAPEGRR
jgi:putative ABC transport system ATP-binding protein